MNDCQNLQSGCPAFPISLMEVVGQVPPSLLHQCIKIYPLLMNTFAVKPCCFGNSLLQPDRVIIFTQLAQQGTFFIIILVFTILPIIGTCKSVQTNSNCNNHSSYLDSGLQVINPALQAGFISSSSCFIAVAATSTRFLSTVVTLST